MGDGGRTVRSAGEEEEHAGLCACAAGENRACGVILRCRGLRGCCCGGGAAVCGVELELCNAMRARDARVR